MRFASTLLFLTACSGGGTDPDLERLLLEASTECGTLDYDNLELTCPAVQDAMACFDGAAQPHVEQVLITIEGDPIYEHFFIDNGVPVMIRDTRDDDFGPQAVTRTECSAIRILEADACSFLICEQ